MLVLHDRWAELLARERETGMGYQVVSIVLGDGRRFDGVTVVAATITSVAGSATVPFSDEDIEQIIVTHDRPATVRPAWAGE